MTRLLLLSALALAACGDAADTPPDAPAEPVEVSDAASSDPAPDTGEAMGASTVTVGVAPEADSFMTTVAAVEQAELLDGQTVPVRGTVSKVCQNRGCWLTLDAPDGQVVRVVVPKGDDGEYLWTFPMDVEGAEAELVGTIAVAEESVETQRHLAEDEGASADDIAAITEARPAVSITAQGARLTRAS